MDGFGMILFGNMDQGRHIGGENECQREGGLEPSQYWTSIHLFHTFSLALVLCRVMRLEPLGHRQDKPLDRWPHITHIHIHTQYSLQFTCPVCIWIVGETQRKPTSTQREHTNSTQKDSWSSWDSNTAHTAPHYTRLMMFLSFFITVFSNC